MKRAEWGLLIMLACGGCVSVAGTPPAIEARPVTRSDGAIIEPANASLGDRGDLRPIGFSRIQSTVPRGAVIGETRFKPLSCFYSEKIHYDSDRRPLSRVAYNDIFFRIFDGHGYNVVGNPNAMFDTGGREQPDFQVGANVTKIGSEFCRHVDSWSGRPDGNYSGVMRVTVNWQVFDPVRRQIVWERDVEGVFETQTPLNGDYDLFVQHAFADAANKAAAEPTLRDLVKRRGSATPQTAANGAPASRQMLERRRPFSQPITSQVEHIRAATVLIEIGDDSHGSGFIISPDGLLVTNQHVVGNQRQVRVRLVSGKVVIGDVLRRHVTRDVALVKIEGDGHPVLPIREAAVQVTEEVYAIGAPQFRQLGWTVTRGVVSAWRPARLPSQPYDLIQADVATHGGNSGGPLLDRHGNVVGICVSGYGRNNQSLNLFIPILDGLDKLGLDLSGPGVPEAARRVSARH